LKKGRKIIFIDFCTASSVSSPASQFYGVSVEKNSIGPLAIKKVPRCQIILVNQENDERVWRNITTFLGNFKCARLQGSNYYDTYVVGIILILLIALYENNERKKTRLEQSKIISKIVLK
jgi:hypothetical protein